MISAKNTMDNLGHKEGSRKGKVHALYDKQGPEAAWVLGKKLKLAEGTLRSWFGAWGGMKPKPKAKAVAKPKAAKLEPATETLLAPVMA